MIWMLLAKFIMKRPPWVQAIVFGMCAGLFVTAAAQANQRDTLISTTVLSVVAVGVVAGGAFYLGLRAQIRRGWTPGTNPPAWVSIAYSAAWVLALFAAIRALFGAGGLKVAVLAIVPIVLLAPPAVLGIRMLAGRPPGNDADAPESGAAQR
jgi:hypothetical protein